MPSQRLGPRARRILRTDLWVTLGPTVLIVAAAFGVTMLFVKPAPPKKITVAIAPDEGGSRYYARRYQEILKRHGIALEVRQTGGSLTHAARVRREPLPSSGSTSTWSAGASPGGCRTNPRPRLPPHRCAPRSAAGSVRFAQSSSSSS